MSYIACAVTDMPCCLRHCHQLFDTHESCPHGLNKDCKKLNRSKCGQGNLVVVVDQPQLVRALEGLNVKGIAAGLGHTVGWTESGDVYSWGWNSDGQLGLGDDQGRSEPQLVEADLLENVHIDKASPTMSVLSFSPFPARSSALLQCFDTNTPFKLTT